jgi:ribosomal protein S18 acetylase RimI-like enzyme
MTGDNLEKMIRLADAFFEAKRDPDQISVNEKEREKLSRIHPATLTQETDENGPIAWILVIPTTGRVMEQFVCRRISERELLEQTPVGEKYDALYLCSALVLPEYRGKGIARRLTADAVRSIQRDHPIRELFYWSFSPEGTRLAKSVAGTLLLPLRERTD